MTAQTSKQQWDAHARRDLRREEREHMHELRRNTMERATQRDRNKMLWI